MWIKLILSYLRPCPLALSFEALVLVLYFGLHYTTDGHSDGQTDMRRAQKQYPPVATGGGQLIMMNLTSVGGIYYDSGSMWMEFVLPSGTDNERDNEQQLMWVGE